MFKNRRIAILVILFVLCQIGFQLLLRKLQQISGTSQILDVLFAYTPQQALSLLTQYGPAGRKLYLQAMFLDMVYPLIYTLLLFEMLRYLAAGKWGLRLPFVVMGLDYLENLLELRMVLGFPEKVRQTAVIASPVTSLKWFLVGLVFLFISYRIWQKWSK